MDESLHILEELAQAISHARDTAKLAGYVTLAFLLDMAKLEIAVLQGRVRTIRTKKGHRIVSPARRKTP